MADSVSRSAEARLRASEVTDEGAATELELARYRKAFGNWEDLFAQGVENAVAAKEAELRTATLKCAAMESVS
jgi:hypothetical protein